jgi:thiol-disulfide isomerase/thioredoxin
VWLFLGIIVPESASAVDHPILYFFWGDGCPHCEKEKEFLEQLKEQYPALEMRWFEVWKHPENRKLADAMRQAYEVKPSSVPITFINRWTTTGYKSDELTGKEIKEQVLACLEGECVDAIEMAGPLQVTLDIRQQVTRNAPVGWELFPAVVSSPTTPQTDTTPQPEIPTQQPLSQQTDVTQSEHVTQSATEEPEPDNQNIIALPVPEWLQWVVKKKVMEIDITKTGLPVITMIIAGLDGFNPCAMWVLSFLLSLVIYAKSRGRIILIGGIFVAASGLIYLFFMIFWFNLLKLIGVITALRIIVALIALVMGIINCKDFFFFKKGISLTIPESAQPKLFKKMRTVVHTTAIPAAIMGTIVLAVTANFIELLCTAGFPLLYANILTMQKLSAFQYYLYLVFYNAVYVIPLAVIVGVFAWRMGGRKMSEKEGRILKLVGGILMLALGLILLFKHEILMFG